MKNIKTKKKGPRGDNIAYLFMLPNIIIYGLFVLIPTGFTIFYSFTNFNLFEWEFVGFRNYTRLFSDDFFVKSIFNTLTYAGGTIFISLALGLILATILNEKVLGRKVFRPLLFLPNTISVIAASMAWLYIYNNNVGVLNYICDVLGLPQHNWLLEEEYAMPSIMALGIWASVGYNMVVFTSGLQAIPGYLYEAAKIDGASALRQFFKITFPLLAPTTFFLFIMAVIRSFQVFGQVYNMTNGGPMNATTTIVHQIYINGFEGYKMGYASAQAVFLLIITALVTLISFKYGNSGGDTEIV